MPLFDTLCRIKSFYNSREYFHIWKNWHSIIRAVSNLMKIGCYTLSWIASILYNSVTVASSAESGTSSLDMAGLDSEPVCPVRWASKVSLLLNENITISLFK